MSTWLTLGAVGALAVAARARGGSRAKLRWRDCSDLAVPPERAGQHEYVVRFTVRPRRTDIPALPMERFLDNCLPTEGWEERTFSVRWAPRVDADIAFCVGIERTEQRRWVVVRILSPVALNPAERSSLGRQLARLRGDTEGRLEPTPPRISDVRRKGSGARRTASIPPAEPVLAKPAHLPYVYTLAFTIRFNRPKDWSEKDTAEIQSGFGAKDAWCSTVMFENMRRWASTTYFTITGNLKKATYTGTIRLASAEKLTPNDRRFVAKAIFGALRRPGRARWVGPPFFAVDEIEFGVPRITEDESIRGSTARTRRRGARDVESLTITRDGWPWPEEVLLYHATTALPTVLREGFKTRAEVGAAALGGGPSNAVSLTYDPRVAESIALGLRILRMGARREISLRELLDWAKAEIPNAMPDVQKYLDSEGITERTIDLYDRGYVHENAGPGGFGGAALPQGAIGDRPDFMGRREHWASWWIPGTRARDEWAVKGFEGNEPFYKIYKAILIFGEGKKECFDPLFFGTDLAPLAKLREEDIGVLTVRARIPRICLDPRGTVDLGYLGPKEAKYWEQWISDEFGYRCAQDVDAMASRGKTWGDGVSSLRSSWHAPKETMGVWTVLDEGLRRPADTMTYLSSLAEIRVYDPRRIGVDEGTSITELVQHARWGHRLTYRYFRPAEDLVGLRPGTLVRQRGGAPWAGSENRRKR